MQRLVLGLKKFLGLRNGKFILVLIGLVIGAFNASIGVPMWIIVIVVICAGLIDGILSTNRKNNKV